MPRFQGDNPQGWLFKADKFFDYYNVTEEQ